MLEKLAPIKVESAKDACVRRLEELILSGEVKPGDRLPPERELALRLGISRPVVHEALVDLAAKGLVRIVPRVGTVVSDFLREGSLALLTSLINYQGEDLDPAFLSGLLAIRMLFETETARLAAENRTAANVTALRAILSREKAIAHDDLESVVAVDFDFHLEVAIASNNPIYPLLVNSFRPVYTTFTSVFFSDPGVVPVVFDIHALLVSAISEGSGKKAAEIMKKLLGHGEAWIRRRFNL